MLFSYEAACGCFVGNGRSRNEDNFYFNQKHLPIPNKGLKHPLKCAGTTDNTVMFAIFDGMGGASKGEEASCKACEVFAEEFNKLNELAMSGKEFMCRACDKANTVINTIAREKQLSTMGTTIAALHLSQDEIVACNMGDSKIFRIRGNQMLQISEDHTDERIMSAMGVKKKPVLLQFLGIPDIEMSIEPYISKGDVKAEDIYVICSDGVTDVLGVAEMYELISRNSAIEAVRQIIAQIEKADGTDNATVIVVKILR